jgi:hypothetical protein
MPHHFRHADVSFLSAASSSPGRCQLPQSVVIFSTTLSASSRRRQLLQDNVPSPERRHFLQDTVGFFKAPSFSPGLCRFPQGAVIFPRTLSASSGRRHLLQDVVGFLRASSSSPGQCRFPRDAVIFPAALSDSPGRRHLLQDVGVFLKTMSSSPRRCRLLQGVLKSFSP